MPPNFGIKEILFQNYHASVSNRPVVMGEESLIRGLLSIAAYVSS